MTSGFIKGLGLGGFMRRTEEKTQETGFDQPLTHVTEGDVEYQGRKAIIKISQERCVGTSTL